MLKFAVFAIVAVAVSGNNFMCQRPGLFPNPNSDDPRDFLLCVNDGNGLKEGHMKCSENTVYSVFQQKCVPPKLKLTKPFQHLLGSFGSSGPEVLSETDGVCRKPGHKCLDCSNLVMCVGVGKGHPAIPVMNGTCSSGLFCEQGVGCVPKDYCNYKSFECSEDGTFPDPYDCQVFHVCSVQNGVMRKETRYCHEHNAAFDQKTGSCRGHLDYDKCDTPMPRCRKNVEIGALEGNPNIYYVCVTDEINRTLSPKLFRCPDGEVFDPIAVECQEPETTSPPPMMCPGV